MFTAFAALLPGIAHAEPAPERATRTVTLITGDQVTLTEGGDVALRPGAGRDGVLFSVDRENGRVRVVPEDALRPLHENRIDPRLFDVTLLLEFGYVDRLPLIVDGPAANARAATPLPDGLTSIDADPHGGTWTALAGAAHARSGLGKIWLDGLMRPALDVSVPQIGAPAAWERGLTGTGTTVAVLDTGIDDTHADLAGQVTAKQNFVTGEDGRDLVGHGTHVASTIAGTGAASDGRYRGVAPGAKLLDGKVCGVEYCPESSILRGMRWAAQQGADVVNMSLGGYDSPGVDPLEAAVQSLTAEFGTLFVIAAGNDGQERGVGSPATADAALAVGAVDREDNLAGFSNRGPRPEDSVLKPEITAPGVGIVAARSGDGEIGEPAPLPGYTTLSGTSMATPHVAGAAAILAQQHPDWTPERLKAGLVGSAKPHPQLPVTAQGGGRVDVARVTAQAVTATPATLSFGFQRWPHQDDDVRSATVTYRNDGAADVLLALSAELVTLSAPTLTVPAGGSASVTVSIDTSVGGLPDGFLDGAVTATAGDLVVRTPFGIELEPESYDVGLDLIGRDGAAAADFHVTFVNKDLRTGYLAYPGSGMLRLPKGNYALSARIRTGQDMTFAAGGRLVVDGGHTSFTVDARAAQPVSVTVPKAGAEPSSIWLGASGPGYSNGIGGQDFSTLYTLNLAPGTAAADYHSHIKVTFGQRNAQGTFDGTPYQYSAFYLTPGTMFTGFTHAAAQSEFATVVAEHGVQAQADTIGKGVFVMHDALGGDSSWSYEYPAGSSRTEYYNAGDGVTWEPFLQELEPIDGYLTPISSQFAAKTAYRPGTTITETWNRAVFGPSFPDEGYRPQIGRVGNVIYALPALFGDGGGREGESTLTGMTIKLYRENVLVGAVADVYGEFTVPAADATYRLEVTADRGAPHRLSTHVAAAWTFRSSEDAATLPLLAVVASPNVSGAGVAPKGRAFTVPLRVDRQGGVARNPRLTAEVSYDDGATWTAVDVRRGVAHLSHPDAAGWVSLRTTATDAGGSSVTQTVIRAYGIS